MRRLKVGSTSISLLLAFGLVIAGDVPAQRSDTLSDPCSCNAALIEGIYAERQSKGDSSALDAVYSYISTASYDEFTKSLSGSGGASFLSFGFSASMTKGEFEAHQKKMTSQYRQSSQRYDSKTLIEKFGDENVLKAWSGCKAQCVIPGHIHSWLDVHDAKNLTLSLRSTLSGEPVKIKGSTLSQGTRSLLGNP